jgi:hypothetical protein
MSKLLKLKDWLTLDEAVLHISALIGEPVTISDLYRFALDGHLKLSVYFSNEVSAVIGKWLKADDIADRDKSEPIQSLFNPLKSPLPNEMFVSGDNWIVWQDGIQQISGVWDLTMQGDEILDLQAYYQHMTSGFNVKVNAENGFGILLQQDDVVCQLYRPFYMYKCIRTGSTNLEYETPQKANGDDSNNLFQHNRFNKFNDYDELERFHILSFNKIRKNESRTHFAPCIHLIEHEFLFVIRTSEINRLIQPSEDIQQEEKPLISTERNPYLILIAALCKKNNVNPKQRGLAVSWSRMTYLRNTPLGENTVLDVLKQIEPITCSKGKRLAATMLTTHGRNTFLVLIAALCQEAKVDYKHKNIAESLVEMTKSNSTPLTEDIISEIVSQIEPAICSRSK